MPNQRAIAKALGLSQATVSRALQGSPLVALETRRRVKEVATEMEYRPNPMVSTLMEHIRSGKDVTERGCIAIIESGSVKTGFPHDAYRHQYEGFCQQASLRGYQTDCFHCGVEGMSWSRIDKILRARGIRGVIFAASSVKTDPSTFRWDRYACAKIGDTGHDPAIDSAATDHFLNVSTAFAATAARGYTRIGFCLPLDLSNPPGTRWVGSYLHIQSTLPASQRIPYFQGAPGNTALAKFRRWYDKWRPDAMLCLWGEEWEWIQQMGLSPMEDMAFVCVNRPSNSIFAGVEENNVVVGKMVCDLVVHHLLQNETGLSSHPRQIFVEGIWAEGETLPARKP